MMIKNISKLSKFGIFKNYQNSGVQDFGKYNLFYGWNGSGKSTLSELFRYIENRSLPPDAFSSPEFSISIEDCSIISQTNIAKTDLNVRTFNENFIKENISWNGIAKSILLVNKGKIIEYETLEALKKKQKSDNDILKNKKQEIQGITASIAKFSTDSARLIRTSFQSIDTSDSYYLNYDKRKLDAFIGKNSEALKSNVPALDEQKVIELTNAAKSDQKLTIPFTPNKVNEDTFSRAKARLDDLLKTSVISQTIQRFVDNNDIKTWVETGLDLHKLHEVERCEFCGNSITEERIKQLEAHFNDAYKAFHERLLKADQWLSAQFIPVPQLAAESELYQEFKQQYGIACTALEKSIVILNNEITAWHNILSYSAAR